MAKKNQLVEAKNPPEKKKKESQTSAPEQIQIFEELERKKKVKLSIVSYAIGVCAVLLLGAVYCPLGGERRLVHGDLRFHFGTVLLGGGVLARTDDLQRLVHKKDRSG